MLMRLGRPADQEEMLSARETLMAVFAIKSHAQETQELAFAALFVVGHRSALKIAWNTHPPSFHYTGRVWGWSIGKNLELTPLGCPQNWLPFRQAVGRAHANLAGSAANRMFHSLCKCFGNNDL